MIKLKFSPIGFEHYILYRNCSKRPYMERAFNIWWKVGKSENNSKNIYGQYRILRRRKFLYKTFSWWPLWKFHSKKEWILGIAWNHNLKNHRHYRVSIFIHKKQIFFLLIKVCCFFDGRVPIELGRSSTFLAGKCISQQMRCQHQFLKNSCKKSRWLCYPFEILVEYAANFTYRIFFICYLWIDLRIILQ